MRAESSTGMGVNRWDRGGRSQGLVGEELLWFGRQGRRSEGYSRVGLLPHARALPARCQSWLSWSFPEGTQDQVCVPLLPISWNRSPHLQVTRADPWVRVRGAGALGEMPVSASGLTRAGHCIDDITCKLWSPLRSTALLEHASVHERLENLARVSGNVS